MACYHYKPLMSDLPHADVLSDATARALYDELGPERMRMRAGARAGAGNARAAWDEFKPYRREGKRSQARAAAAAAAGASGANGAGGRTREPVFGDVVEYPLRAVEVADLCDGRSAGVGLLARRLPFAFRVVGLLLALAFGLC